ncbi:hypothetical protein AGMMS49936_07730 [Endomicrobiia bacterium]|nr:hypothetical protein AGMMS49936_07730 [Endomicrobiia bacterium]
MWFLFNKEWGRTYNIIMLILLLSFVAYAIARDISRYRQDPQGYMENIGSTKFGKFLLDKLGVKGIKFIGWILTVPAAIVFIWFIKRIIIDYCI